MSQFFQRPSNNGMLAFSERCSGGVLAIDFTKSLLQSLPNSYAMVLSTECKHRDVLRQLPFNARYQLSLSHGWFCFSPVQPSFRSSPFKVPNHSHTSYPHGFRR